MGEANSERVVRARPLSPHLQIYRPQINMVMSVFHRLTGSALYFGAALIAWWLIAAATGPDYFAFVNGLFATWVGMIVIVGYTWAGLDIASVNLLSWGTIVLSLLLTAGLWLYIAAERGWMAS